MVCRRSIAAAQFLTVMALLGLGYPPVQASAPAAAQSATTAAGDNPLQLTADHVTISVADIDKEEAWYAQVLGFKEFVSRGNPGDDFRHCELRIPGVYRIDLSYRRGSVRHTVGAPSDMEQGWRHIVFKTANLEDALRYLRVRNVDVKVDRNPKDNAINQLFITDPEGNEIELQ